MRPFPNMIPVSLDVETTGTGDDDRLVEVAYKVRGQDCVSERFDPSMPMSVEAMAACHITTRMLEGKPAFKGSAFAETLYQILSTDDHVLVAHNAQFDIKMLEREGFPRPPTHIDTFKIAHHHDLDATLAKHHLQYLRYLYFENTGFTQEIIAHSASSDVLVLEKLLEFYEQFYTLEEMVAISSKPILFKKITFGKYKGEFFKDITRKDTNYLLWMKREMKDLDENMRYTINYWIEHRADV